MINIPAFFALARAQVARATSTSSEVGDKVLASLVPQAFHPTAQSAVRATMELVPENQRVLFAVACHWTQEAPGYLIDSFSSQPMMEARGRMVDAGAITVPPDAPCRTWPWQSVVNRLNGHMVSAKFHARLEPMFGLFMNQLLADARPHLVEPEGARVPWVHLSDEEARGLGWVNDDDGRDGGPELGPVVIEQILHEAGLYWYRPNLVQPWTADSVARWAGVCMRYVEARRGK
jgi:hypothetical protein